MAAVARTVTGKGQKLTRVTTAAAQEDVYTLTSTNLMGLYYVQIQPTTFGVLYHSIAGQTATDGYPVAAGQTLTIAVTNGVPFYLGGLGIGTVDCLVL